MCPFWRRTVLHKSARWFARTNVTPTCQSGRCSMRIVIVVLVAILVGTPSQAIGGDRIAGNWFDAESSSRYRFHPSGDFSFGLTLPPNSLYHGAYRLGNCGGKRPGNLTLLWENGVEVCYSTQFTGTRLHLMYRVQRLLSGFSFIFSLLQSSVLILIGA